MNDMDPDLVRDRDQRTGYATIRMRTRTRRLMYRILIRMHRRRRRSLGGITGLINNRWNWRSTIVKWDVIHQFGLDRHDCQIWSDVFFQRDRNIYRTVACCYLFIYLNRKNRANMNILPALEVIDKCKRGKIILSLYGARIILRLANHEMCVCRSETSIVYTR